MFNLIKKDFIVSMKTEGKGILKYGLLFLFFYFFQNSISYSVVPVFIGYLMVANTFYNDYKNNNSNFINSIPTSKEDVVYSKYILAIITIVSLSIVVGVVTFLFEPYFHRSSVMNDVYYSIVIFIVIMSVVLPIYFKFGYHNSRLVAGGIGVAIFYLVFIPMELISTTLHSFSRGSIGGATSFIGPFSKFFEVMINFLNSIFGNGRYSMEIVVIISLLIFILSMFISLKCIRNKKLTLNITKFIKVSLSILISVFIFILINKGIYKDLIHEEDYSDKYANYVDISIDEEKLSEEGLTIRVKIDNPTKYVYKLDMAEIQFERNWNIEEGDIIPSNLKVDLPWSWEMDSQNDMIRTKGIPPKSSGYIEFLISKGIILDPDYFILDSININYNGDLVSRLPFTSSGYITINSQHGGSTTLGTLLLEELSKAKKGE